MLCNIFKYGCNYPLQSKKLTLKSHLRPGGQLELIKLNLTPRCDDKSLPSNSKIMTWWKHVEDTSNKTGRPLTFDINSTQQLLLDIGFDTLIPLPHKLPIGFDNSYQCDQCRKSNKPWNENCVRCDPWPHSTAARTLGRYYESWLTDPNHLDALSLGCFSRFQVELLENWENFRESVIQEMLRIDVHVYNEL